MSLGWLPLESMSWSRTYVSANDGESSDLKAEWLTLTFGQSGDIPIFLLMLRHLAGKSYGECKS